MKQNSEYPIRQYDSCKPLFEYIDLHFEDYIRDVAGICEVPAPTFHEEERAQYFAQLFEKLGFNVRIDEVGNVVVPIQSNGAPHAVLSAHLDTVFNFTRIRVTRENEMLRAPGITDDSAGLAALYLIVRAIRETGFQLLGTLTVVATVGEEGLGNLRGVKHFFETNRKGIDYFISLDGCDADRLVTSGLASKRLRIYFCGPGGHSWGDAGTPNPIHASGEFLSRIHRLVLPRNPKTSINVGIIEGGTSINAIPTEVHMDIDLRSESAESLTELNEFVHEVLKECAYANSVITTESEVLGERPSGVIAQDHKLVRAAVAANQQFGLPAKLDVGSTDSNIPFALGIPALTLGVGGRSGKIHTPEEWYDVTGAEKGLKRIALFLVELLNSPND
jgi:acetylornithine deacetylase/succinyl-diaminopimelate desuccinylase-like protein